MSERFQSLLRRKSVEAIVRDSRLHPESHTGGMNRNLSVVDLTSFGIAAIIGAGIFSTIGAASVNGGPGVVFLFVFTAIACGFSAFCYAEFASQLPVSGSAYTYAYASLGELVAWIIGWDLLMEYAIGNIAVAISWSDYFTSLLKSYGIHIPLNLTMDYLTAHRGHDAVMLLLEKGVAISDLAQQGISGGQLEAYQAMESAPRVFGFPLVADLPALAITVLVTWVVYVGIQESKRLANLMVLLKILVLFLVIGVGATYVQPANWSPFMPNGIGGVLRGVSGVFFAYIGFDAISTTAEECRNPQRDLPRAMIYSLIICTVLYIAVALVLTGMVPYSKLGVGDPLAFIFGSEGVGLNWMSGVIAISAVIALFSVMLVFQLGQPRIWMAMSRDGLLPPLFGALHPKFRTPWFSTLVTGLLVGIPCLFMNLTEVTDLTSIGTLAAFLLVSLGVLRLDPNRPREPGKFRMPQVGSRWIFPVIAVLALGFTWLEASDSIRGFFRALLEGVDPAYPGESGWSVMRHRIPMLAYLLGMGWLLVATLRKNLSLIPVMGVATTGYLMTELGWVNWVRFGLWLLVGLAIYFFYGIRASHLARASTASPSIRRVD